MKDISTLKLMIMLIIVFISILFMINIKFYTDSNQNEYVFLSDNLNLIISFFSLIFSIITLWFGIVIFDKFGLSSFVMQKEFNATYEVKRYLEIYSLYKFEYNVGKVVLGFNNNSVVNMEEKSDDEIYIEHDTLNKIYTDIKTKILNTEYFPSELSEKLNLNFLINNNIFYKEEEFDENKLMYSTDSNKIYRDKIKSLKYINKDKSFISCWKKLIIEIENYQTVKYNYSSKPS
jgi:hypothetical protein